MIQEDYLDLPVTLMGCNSLEESLQMLYIALEVLEGRNQYRCGSCDKLVDAIKVSCVNISNWNMNVDSVLS